MDRPTGNYNHERLIALEDSHKQMRRMLEIAKDFMSDGHKMMSEILIKEATKIREEAGL